MIRFFLIFYFLMTLNISAAEYLKFNSPDNKFPNNPEVLVEISLPKEIKGKLRDEALDPVHKTHCLLRQSDPGYDSWGVSAMN